MTRQGSKGPAMKNLIAILFTTLLLASCAVGPNYRAPQVAPAVVHNAQTSAFVTQSPEALWWQEFDDRARQPGAACAWRQFGSALRVRPSPRSPRRVRGEKTRLRTACAVGRRVLAF